MNLKRYNLINLTETEVLGKELADLFAKKQDRQIVFLEGDLGVGKTTLVQVILKNLGICERVKSPTYSLIEPYQTPQGYKIYHIDLYRLHDEHELEHLGLKDLLEEPALFLIEWPKILTCYNVQPDFVLEFKLLNDGLRSVCVIPA